jgi:porin
MSESCRSGRLPDTPRVGSGVRRRIGRLACLATLTVLAGAAFAEADPSHGSTVGEPPQDSGVADVDVACDGLTRPRATGDWGGYRGLLENHGLRIDLDATYTIQGLATGGLRDPFTALTSEDRAGNTYSSDLIVEVDTAKTGLWSGGLLRMRVEGRVGESLIERAGTVSPVGNEPLYPNVVDDFDDPVIAFTELTYTQSIGAGFHLSAGLLDTAEGDANEFAGSALSNERFLNSAFLYSLVEDATVPNTTLGGSIFYEPSERVAGSFSVFGTTETAGTNPFANWNGTTFSTEWTFAHELIGRSGSQTLGFLYGIDARRTDIAKSPRVAIASALLGGAVPTTTADSWSIYYNADQFVTGDVDRGLGLFVRFGLSDGDPNAVHWNTAFGLGGSGLLSVGAGDRFGVGFFYVRMSDQALVRGLGIGDELGGELFYSVAVTPWLHFTADAQVVAPGLPISDTVVVLALRTRVVL